MLRVNSHKLINLVFSKSFEKILGFMINGLAGCDGWLVLICYERKVLLASW